MKSPYQTNYQSRTSAPVDEEINGYMGKAARSRRLIELEEMSERLAKSSPCSKAENDARNQALRGVAERRMAIINSTHVSRAILNSTKVSR